jgi:hypothetical protein
VVEQLLRGGVSGVMVCACPPRDCASREGPKWLSARFYGDREAELQARVDRRRVRIVTLAPGALGAALTEYADFAREVSPLSAPERAPDPEPDFVCDPIRFAEDTR